MLVFANAHDGKQSEKQHLPVEYGTSRNHKFTAKIFQTIVAYMDLFIEVRTKTLYAKEY